MKLVAVILTLNEEQHLPRCLASLDAVIDQVLIADCFSTDDTVRIAQEYGAQLVQQEWVNYATQFNWALTQLDDDVDWVLRIDADEYLTSELAAEIKEQLPAINPEVDGVCFGRRMKFQGRLIRHGGVFPVSVLRLFRYGRGECENRWMDEHIKVKGMTVGFPGELIDDNLNSITWWTEKHNSYASREVVDILNMEYQFMPHDSVAALTLKSEAGLKRWVKEFIYARLPGGFRAFAYFLYRYIVRLGFLDGKSGADFHFLQGFWYRYLVDVKITEVKRYMIAHDCEVVTAINRVLEIKI